MFRLPQQGLPRYLLTGAFTLEQVQEWNKNNHRAAVTRWATEPQEAAPRNLHLISASPDDAAQWANANGIPIASQTGPHYMVCNHTATKQHLDQGAWEPHHELNHLRRNFDARILRFSNASTDQPRLTQYENPITRSIHYALICNDRRLRLPRSDGIYALLHLAEKTVLRYNEEQHVLLVPLRAPLPDFLARAVFLASGINPRHEVLEDTKQNALAYPAIHPQMASTIFDELGQDWSQR